MSTTESTSTNPKRPLWFRILGLRRREGKRLRIGFTLWGWVLAVLVVAGVGMGAFAEYSMQPDFCRSCHIMEPYYQAWHSSTHKDVACVKCHFEPGLENTLKGKWQASSQAAKYITNTYGSKPHAEIQDASCMRSGCHEKRLLEGKVNWTVDSSRGGKVTIRFDHAPHLQQEKRGKQLRCVSCHSQIVQGQHLVVTLDTCFLCHFKGKEHGRNEQAIAGCTSCHEAPKSQITLTTGLFNHGDYLSRGVTCENCHADAIKGDGAVPRQTCWNCHNQPKQVARYGETNFIHSNHVTKHKVECASCHIQIEHNLNAGAMSNGKKHGDSLSVAQSGSCASCHSQTHDGPAELYRGVGGRGVPDMPSPMSRAHVNCIACHKTQKMPGNVAAISGQTFTAAQASCDYCHGNKYDGVLETWKLTIVQNLSKTETAYAAAKSALEGVELPGSEMLRAQRLLDDADHNIRLVKHGHGVHNVNYATALLSVAQDNSQKVAKMAATKTVSGGP